MHGNPSARKPAKSKSCIGSKIEKPKAKEPKFSIKAEILSGALSYNEDHSPWNRDRIL